MNRLFCGDYYRTEKEISILKPLMMSEYNTFSNPTTDLDMVSPVFERFGDLNDNVEDMRFSF